MILKLSTGYPQVIHIVIHIENLDFSRKNGLIHLSTSPTTTTTEFIYYILYKIAHRKELFKK